MLELIFLVTCCSSLPGPFWEAPPPSTSKILPRVRFSIIFCIFILTILWQYPSLLFNLFVIVRSFTCFARSSPSNSSEGSLFAEHKDLNSVLKKTLLVHVLLLKDHTILSLQLQQYLEPFVRLFVFQTCLSVPQWRYLELLPQL